jgi:hypothetical protein
MTLRKWALTAQPEQRFATARLARLGDHRRRISVRYPKGDRMFILSFSIRSLNYLCHRNLVDGTQGYGRTWPEIVFAK